MVGNTAGATSAAAGTASSGNSGNNTGAGIHADVTLKLSQLQNLCKRDPAGYVDEYEAQIRRLESEFSILVLTGDTAGGGGGSSSSGGMGGGAPLTSNLTELIQFAAAVSSSSYKGKESDRIANLFMNVLVGGGDSYTNDYFTFTENRKKSSKNSSTTTSKVSSVTQITSMPAAAFQLHRDIRKSVVSALILMRNKGCIEPLLVLELFFRIMAVIPDKALREVLYKHIVNDIRNINTKGKRDEVLNRSIQSFLHRIVSTHGNASVSSNNNSDDVSTATSSSSASSATEIAGKRAVDMVCELYRRRVWTDERTVSILASAVESKNITIMCRAIRFFLNIEEKMAHDDAQKQEQDCMAHNATVDYHLYSRKTAARQRETKRQLKAKKRAQQKKELLSNGGCDWIELTTPDNDKGVPASKKLYPAIELLRDPYGLAETCFQRLRTGGNAFKYETKLLLINFITRLVGNHELLILPLYSFLQKYMLGHQRDVTAVLAYTVQACHEHVPPDEVYGILKTIASNFISERCSEEQMAVGINAVRAICGRVPSAMNVEESQQTLSSAETSTATGAVVMDIEAFTRDLAAYAKHRDRSVAIAGKSWMNFVREVNPTLLQGKDRGLHGTAIHKSGIQPARYGEHKIAAGVEGADLLMEYEMKKKFASAGKKHTEDDGTVSEDEALPQNDVAGDGENDDKHWEEVEEEEVSEGDDESGDWQDMDDEEENQDEKEDNEGNGQESEDEQAPELVLLDGESNNNSSKNNDAACIPDISKMSTAERDKIKQQVSSTRIFTTAEFAKMRKLVEREKQAKRDPRENARRKRAIARGEEFEALSDDDDDDDSSVELDDAQHSNINIKGAVSADDIMALATKKRQSKAERLVKILAGRTGFEAKARNPSGSTNTEKERKKNFLMSKFSLSARSKGRGKGNRQKKRKDMPMSGMRDGRKRRRKM